MNLAITFRLLLPTYDLVSVFCSISLNCPFTKFVWSRKLFFFGPGAQDLEAQYLIVTKSVAVTKKKVLPLKVFMLQGLFYSVIYNIT